MTVNIQPKYGVLIGLFLILIVYSLYQARALIMGPRIWIDHPKDGQIIADPVVTLKGRSKDIAWLSLNDHQIFTDETGWWSEKLIVPEGLSIITVKARDRFGREVERAVRVFLN